MAKALISNPVSTSDISKYIGTLGEVIFDNNTGYIYIHDGVTQGGIPVLNIKFDKEMLDDSDVDLGNGFKFEITDKYDFGAEDGSIDFNE